MKVKIPIIVFLLLFGLYQSLARDTTTIAYMGVPSYEIDFSTIEKIQNTKIADFEGSYHFGESEGESTLEIIYSNGKLFARSIYADWENDQWALKNDRERIRYKKGKIEIGKYSYELYQCIKTTYHLLEEGEQVLVSHIFEDVNNKPYHFIQLNINSPLKIPEGKYPETNFVKLTPIDLKLYSKDELKIMRNEIFARKGYVFKKGGSMEQYFLQKKWYNLIKKTKHPNLNDIERHNVNTILELEKE